MSRAAAHTLTVSMAGILAAFRERCSTTEMITSLAAAILVEHEKRPFSAADCDMLMNLLLEEEVDAAD